MKVSIVLPVYNGEETLKNCLQAILDIDYPAKDYQLTVVNDGSKDKSLNIMKSFVSKFKKKGVDINIVDLKKNQGRVKARMAGAEKAKYDNLLFIDHRCIADKDILKNIKKKDYEPIIGNLYQEREGTLINRFFYTFRYLLYKPYFGLEYPEVYINKRNFDNISKGTSPFFCDKQRFFESLPENKNDWASDDTLVFRIIVKKKEILKTSEVRCLYLERHAPKEFFKHLYERGPKFVDYYSNPKTKYFFIIPALLLFPFVFLGLVFLLKWGFLYLIGILALLVLFYLLFNGFVFVDFIAMIFVGFPVLLSFTAGVYKGVLIKLFKKR
ncbi:MAG: glycosyltransferase [Candidatus Dojkabacteria bacterium]|jgi:glycosyltransferase involved in cell wall biosynthesis